MLIDNVATRRNTGDPAATSGRPSAESGGLAGTAVPVKILPPKNVLTTMIRLLPLLIALLLPPLLAAQDPRYRIEHLSTADGLSQSTVLAMHQDRHGFLWFGTRDGLDRYDGYRFRSFRYDPLVPTSLSGVAVTAIAEDSEGDIWAGTMMGGINRLDRRSGRFERIRADGVRLPIMSGVVYQRWLSADSNGGVWIATEAGLERYDRRRGRFVPYPHGTASGLPEGNIASIYVDRTGLVWVSSGDRRLSDFHYEHRSYISRYDRERDRFTTWTIAGNSTLFEFIGENEDGTLMLAESDIRDDEPLAFRFDPATGSMTPMNVPSRLDATGLHASYLARHLDRQGDCWYVSANVASSPSAFGTYRLYREPLIPYRLDDDRRVAEPAAVTSAMPSPIVTCLRKIPLVGRSGAIWMPTASGVARITHLNDAVTTWRSDSGDPTALSAPRLRAVRRDRHGILWAATDFGLNRLDPASGRWHRYFHDPDQPGSLPSSTVNVIVEDRKGRLLFGTNLGLVAYDRRNDRFVDGAPNLSIEKIALHPVWSLVHDRRGAIWIGTGAIGVARLDSTGALDRLLSNDPADTTSITAGGVYSMLETRRGEIWIGTNHGLNRWLPESDRFRRYTHRPGDTGSLGGKHIWALHEDRAGDIWACSYGGGISRYNRESDDFTTITTRDGLIDNGVVGLLEDERGDFWISTTRGLSVWNRRDGSFRHYDEGDGLQGREFAFKAHFKDDDGTLYFGGVEGLSAIRPTELRENGLVPTIAITGFHLFDSLAAHELLDGDTVRLDHTQNFFSFEFAALDYTNPGKNSYAYRLEGVDRDWVYVGSDRRVAGYTDLSPGTYTFRVRGANNDGVWNMTGIAVTLIIAPPVWGTWWFRGAAIALSLGLIALAASIRVNRLRRHEREKRESAVQAALEMQEAERQRIARDLHDGIGQLLAAARLNLARAGEMFGRDGLRGRGDRSDRGDEEIISSIERTAEALNYASDDVRTISHALGTSTLSELGLAPALSEQLVNLRADETMTFDFVTSGMERRLPEPIETGLFRIAQELIANIVRHAGACDATIQIVRQGDVVRMTVEDNGSGFDPAANGSGGMGRRNIVARTEAMGGQVFYDSTPGHGTTVTVIVPLLA